MTMIKIPIVKNFNKIMVPEFQITFSEEDPLITRSRTTSNPWMSKILQGGLT